MTDNPRPDANGHGNPLGAFKKPAPHPVPSVAARMAQADAERDAAAQAELERRTAELKAHVAFLLANDPAGLIMAIPDLFFASFAEMVAAGVQMGIQRAAQAELQKTQQQGPAEAAARKPILLAQGELSSAMVRAAGGTPGAFTGTPQA